MKKFETIVVGGGYAGCSVAYHLARAGVKTLLLEKNEVASGVSGGNMGSIQVQDAIQGLSWELTQRSFKRVMRFEEELKEDLELLSVGSVICATNAKDMDKLNEFYLEKKEAGLDIEILGKDKLRKIEPNLNVNRIVGATRYVQGKLNPFKLIYAFLRRGKEMGLQVLENTRVRELYMERGEVCGVLLESGERILSEQVVVAAGAWTKELCKTAGLFVPIEYVRSEAFVTEKIAPYINNAMSVASFFSMETDEDNANVYLCLSQTKSGNIIVGETCKPGELSPDEASRLTSPSHLYRIKQALVEILPGLESLNILRSWTAASPYTDSLEPVLGNVGPGGLLVASGFKSCVIMTAVAGEIITDLVVKGKTFCDLSSFNAQVSKI